MVLERTAVTVRVPGTSANLGPGFDCLGMALNVWNQTKIEVGSSLFFSIEGEGAEFLPKDNTNLIHRGVELIFEKAGMDLPPMQYTCRNNIPFGVGLGSSAAALAAGLLGGATMLGYDLTHEFLLELLGIGAEIEAAADNLAACLFGSLQLCLPDADRWVVQRIPLPTDLSCVLVVPFVRNDTNASRQLLRPSVPRSDAVFNVGRVSLVVHALSSNQPELLRTAVSDKLHQPVRATTLPALLPVIAAAEAAGAYGM